jgi:hypothetical protein
MLFSQSGGRFLFVNHFFLGQKMMRIGSVIRLRVKTFDKESKETEVEYNALVLSGTGELFQTIAIYEASQFDERKGCLLKYNNSKNEHVQACINFELFPCMRPFAVSMAKDIVKEILGECDVENITRVKQTLSKMICD